MSRLPPWMWALLVGACRLHIDELPASDDAMRGGDADDAPGPLQVVVIGQGAVTGTGVSCTGACSLDAAAPITLTATPWEGWQLTSFSAPCDTSATCIAAPGATVTVTFAPAPITANRVFLLSMGPATDAGVNALDAACQARAAAGGLTSDVVAFVSTSTRDARDRLVGSRGWVRIDGLPFIDQVTDLGRADLPRAVSFDALGALSNFGAVRTGSDATGVRSSSTCVDWTSAAGALSVDGASPNSAGVLATGNGSSPCGSIGSYFCFERGRTVPVSITPAPFPAGRRVFSTTQTLAVGAGGVPAADALCADEATTAGLPGTYRALLATTTTSASDRIGGLAGPWIRADGSGVAWGALDQRPLDASLGWTATGARADTPAWFGAASLTAVGTAATTCDDLAAASTSTPQLLTPISMLATSEPAITNQVCGSVAYRLLCAQLP